MNRTDLVSRLSRRGSRPPARAPYLALALAAAASLAALTACSSSSSSSSASGATASASSSGTSSANQTSVSGVTLHIGDQAGTGAEALLTAAGLINKLPFKVAWSDFTSGPPMLQAMGAGAIDVGGVGNAPPVFAAAGGEKIAIVGAYQANPHGSALLVPKNSPITSVAQLKGKRIAVAQGSSADYHLLTVLNKAGLSVHDVTLTYLQPPRGSPR
jgi:sulfonate transport system substrate-binding protein